MRPRLANDHRRLERADSAAAQAMQLMLARRRGMLERLEAKLSQLSPVRILERGYAIVSNEGGIVTDSAAAPPGSTIQVRLARGGLEAEVTGRR